MDKKVLIKVENLKQWFPLKKVKLFQDTLYVKANDGIDLEIYEGETLGLVGESGCGKSTLGRTLLQLYTQTGGRTLYYGYSVEAFAPEYVVKQLRAFKKDGNKQDAQEIKRILGGFFGVEEQTECVEELLLQYELVQKVKESNPSTKQAAEQALATQQQKIAILRRKYENHPAFKEYEKEREEGIDLTQLTEREMRFLRKEMQLIFQDPYSSLNPRMTVGQIIGEGLLAHGICGGNGEDIQQEVTTVMEKCGLAPYMIHRYPHQFSGGQRQRIGIARSLALNPKFVVCDEAVSALDVSIQSQIINLLQDLKEEEKLTYLFISHDLSVVKYISDRIGVMYLGNMVELAPSANIFKHPRHPYTEALMLAIPSVEVDAPKDKPLLEGDIPSPVNPPKGCKFHPRCRYCSEVCKNKVPDWTEMEPGHFVACHHPLPLESKE